MSKQFLGMFFGLAISLVAQGQSKGWFQKQGVAVNGYDVVAYFTQGQAVPGQAAFTFQWQGANWQFATARHLALFKENPEKYAPQYGGYCAYGCSQHHQSPTNPQAFTIVDGKLYLNYSAKVKQLWLPDTAQHIVNANSFWNGLQ